jgi:hypothetical protein
MKSKSNTKDVNIVYKKVEDTKVVISSRKSKKDMQYNDQKKKYKIWSNNLQNTTLKLKIEQHEIYLKPGMKYGAPVVFAVPDALVQHEL